VAVAGELATQWATQGGIVGEEADDAYTPHEFLHVNELDVGE
jgi:hypothetical protein